MPITVLPNSDKSVVRTATGMTSGNETVFQVAPELNTTVELIPTSPGSATIEATMSPNNPVANVNSPISSADFTDDSAGPTTVRKLINLGTGLTYVSANVTSGVWTLRVSNI